MPDPLCHLEVQVHDAARAAAFYAKVFGWSFTRESAHYSWIGTGGPLTAGLAEVGSDQPVRIVSFVQVDDARRSSEAARAAGGAVIRDVTEVPEHGRYALVQDPEGNVIGVWEKPPHGPSERPA
jgi:predicted enzyme related to lactoylglutathione lyase